jgi:hypothetical protein
MTKAKQAEPPSWLQRPHFMVGQDRRGNWVVQDPGEIAAASLWIAMPRSGSCVPKTDIKRRPS